MKRRITENLDLELDDRTWRCHHCGATLGPATEPYKHGCVVAARDPHEVWRQLVDEQITFSYSSSWCQLVEFYCPGCGWMIELEVLPPGHPITNDIELDLDVLEGRPGTESEVAR